MWSISKKEYEKEKFFKGGGGFKDTLTGLGENGRWKGEVEGGKSEAVGRAGDALWGRGSKTVG